MQRLGPEPMTVIGAGSWGTALAIQLAREGHPRGCGPRCRAIEAMRTARRNARYLPGAHFPETLQVRRPESGARRSTRRADRRAFARVPRDLESVKPLLGPQTRIAWATKDRDRTGMLPHQVAGNSRRPPGGIVRPTFAKESAPVCPPP